MLIKEKFESITEVRKNAIVKWNSHDPQHEYRAQYKNQLNRYKPNEFDYAYNSDGFRCDDFSAHSDLPIVFIGCSHTEGTGLPVEHTWSYMLWAKICAETGKNIPYWNIALSGSAIDTQAAALYWLITTKKIIPTHIIGLLPPFNRRDVAFETPEVEWFPYNKRRFAAFFVIDDCFAIHQSLRSLKLIDALRLSCNAKLTYSCWVDDHRDQQIVQQQFPWFRDVEHPDSTYVKSYARDFWHYGKEWHDEACRRYWEVLKNDF